MILIYLKNLKHQKNQSTKKQKHYFLRKNLCFLMEGNKLKKYYLLIEQANFTYSPLALKALKPKEDLKALKPEENQEQKLIEGLFPKKTNKIKNDIDKITKWNETSKEKTNKYLFVFEQFETIRSFGDSIYSDKINIDEAELNQTNLLENMVKFNNKSKPKAKEGKDKRTKYFWWHKCKKKKKKEQKSTSTYVTLWHPLDWVRVARIANVSHRKVFDCMWPKVLIPKQMLQRLPIARAQLKAGNISKNLLNEIRQIIYFLYWVKEIARYRKIAQYNECNKVIKQNGYYIYKL